MSIQYLSKQNSILKSRVAYLQNEINEIKSNQQILVGKLNQINLTRNQITMHFNKLTKQYEQKIKVLQNKCQKLTKTNQKLLNDNRVYQEEITIYEQRFIQKQKLITMLFSQQHKPYKNLDLGYQNNIQKSYHQKTNQIQKTHKKILESSIHEHNQIQNNHILNLQQYNQQQLNIHQPILTQKNNQIHQQNIHQVYNQINQQPQNHLNQQQPKPQQNHIQKQNHPNQQYQQQVDIEPQNNQKASAAQMFFSNLAHSQISQIPHRQDVPVVVKQQKKKSNDQIKNHIDYSQDLISVEHSVNVFESLSQSNYLNYNNLELQQKQQAMAPRLMNKKDKLKDKPKRNRIKVMDPSKFD